MENLPIIFFDGDFKWGILHNGSVKALGSPQESKDLKKNGIRIFKPHYRSDKNKKITRAKVIKVLDDNNMKLIFSESEIDNYVNTDFVLDEVVQVEIYPSCDNREIKDRFSQGWCHIIKNNKKFYYPVSYLQFEDNF